MSVNYSLTVLTNRLQQVANAIDGGGSGGFIILLDAANNTLSSLPLAFPCGVAAAGQLTFSGTPLVDPAATGSGDAHFAWITDSTGAVIISGLTVGSGSTAYDINLTPSPTIAIGQTISVTAASIIGN